MNLLCLDASDIIAIAAVFIAIITPLIQTIYGRRREWHDACELLFRNLSALYEEINLLTNNPNEVNHISYQYYLKERMFLFDHYSKRFISKKRKIKKAQNILKCFLMDLPKQIEYEEVIIKGKNNRISNYKKFIEEIRNYTIKASEALIE
jgi:hypothetical protein